MVFEVLIPEVDWLDDPFPGNWPDTREPPRHAVNASTTAETPASSASGSRTERRKAYGQESRC